MFSALIIDADEAANASIRGALAPYGFEFTATQDASEAMNLARSATPDIIFLRVELPNVSGFSVCNKLRRSDETKYIPLVMYASDVSTDVFDQHRNLKTHADDYLKLPFGTEQLVSSVGGLIPLADPSTFGSTPEPAEDLEVG
ncbi:MAG: response regulator, partial [Myxococcota bacterium]